MSDELESVTENSPVTPEGGDSQEIEVRDNPAWEPVLSLVPEQIQNKMKDHFSQWDSNYRKLQDEYNDYKTKNGPREASPFDEFNGIDPQDIRVALQISQTIASDPKRVATLMAEQLGLTLSEAKEIVKEAEQSAPKVEFDEDDDPRLKQFNEMLEAQRAETKQLREQQQAWLTAQQQREQAQREQYDRQQADQRVDLELQALFKDHPELNKPNDPSTQAFMNQIFMTAGVLSQQGSQNPLRDAYTQVSGLIHSNRSSEVQKSTPLFVPTGGQAPPVSDNADKSNREKAIAIIEAMRSNGQG